VVLRTRVDADRRMELIGYFQDLSSREIQRSLWIDEDYEVGKFDKILYSYYEVLVLDWELDVNPERWIGVFLNSSEEASHILEAMRLFSEIYQCHLGSKATDIVADTRWCMFMALAERVYIMLLFGE
jgi:hypothetical protein